MGLNKNEFNMRPKGLECSYCESAMLFTQRKVKRPVPQGAKDLNIYDEVAYWQCKECGQTSTDFLTTCNTCGSEVVNFIEDPNDNYMRKLSSRIIKPRYPQGSLGIFGYLRERGNFKDEKYPEQCLNCVTCEHCKKKIYNESAEVQHFFDIVAIEDSEYTYFFFHEGCVEQSSLNKAYESELKKLRKGGRRAFSGRELLGCLGPLVLVTVVVLAIYWLGSLGLKQAKEIRANQGQQVVWTMRAVNTTKLNVRSSPGANSPVVAQFNQGARLATSGEPVNVGGDLWIKVSTDDGKIQGWANRKYLSP
jgi:hypothetical protein